MFNSNLGEIVGHTNCICLSRALSIAAIIYSLSNVFKTSCITKDILTSGYVAFIFLILIINTTWFSWVSICRMVILPLGTTFYFICFIAHNRTKFKNVLNLTICHCIKWFSF